MNTYHQIWSLTSQEVYKNLITTPQGLSESEANLRLKQYGYNQLPEPQTRSLILRFIDQLTHFMALLLWVAGILAFISQNPELGWAIWAVIWINAIFSFWQEFQAEKALSALKQILPDQVKVYRDATLCTIPARELVPGDVIQLEEGDKISADARLVESQSLYVDVSILTGESLPVSQSSEPVATENLRALDAINLVFAGSTVAAGRGLAVVDATGTHTEFGQVAHLTANLKREPSTELREQENAALEQDLIFIGLVAMIDPPRPEVADAIALCHLAGIQVTMITGDYGLTAAAIAQKIGLINDTSNSKPRVITGEKLGHLSDAQLQQILHKHKH